MSDYFEIVLLVKFDHIFGGLPIFSMGLLDAKLVRLNFLHSEFMEIIRWMRVILSSIFILLGLGFGTYFYIKEHPITSIDPQGCIVRLSPADDFTIIPFGDPSCPKSLD